jgi:hypothetical protein
VRGVDGVPSERRLLVSGRAVARYWGVHHALVAQAQRAGLLHRQVVTAPGTDRVVEQGYDAGEVLELGSRPLVDPDDMVAFEDRSLLLVQQTSIQRHRPGDVDWPWRSAYGWHTSMSTEEALLSACGWWNVDVARRPGVQAVVSAVSGFVVTLAVVDRSVPPVEHPDGRVRFAVTAADDTTALGRHLLRVFAGHRVPVRKGVARLVPRAATPLG